MRVTLLITCFAFLLFSCSKNEEINDEKTYTGTNGTAMTMAHTEWMVLIVYGYDQSSVANNISVHFRTTGNTNGDSMKIKFMRDDKTVYEKIDLNNTRSFYIDNIILTSDLKEFETIAPSGEFTKEVEMIVYKGADSLKVALNSGTLKYK